MTGKEVQRVVVGVDGSACSKVALAWALRQAELNGARVEAVSAWQDVTMYGYSLGNVPPPYGGESLAVLAQKVLDQSIDEVSAALGRPIEVVRRVEAGRAAQLLPAIAEGALMLVVGSRGHGAFAGMLLGSVSQHCVQHPPCPVVVIPCPEPVASA